MARRRASAGTSTTFFHHKPHHRLDIDTLIDRIANHFLGCCIDFFSFTFSVITYCIDYIPLGLFFVVISSFLPHT